MATTIGADGRAHWMDSLRGLAVLAVMLTHVGTMPRGMDAPYTSLVLTSFVQILHTARMPLLIFLSGVLLTRSVSKPPAQYFRGKAEKILWPFLVWMVLLALSLGTPEQLTSWDYWKGGAWHLWFLWVLMGCYLVGPVTRWVPPWMVAVVFFGLLLAAEGQSRDILRLLHWGVFFFLGASAGRHLHRITRLHWSLAVVAAVWTVAAIVAHMEGALTVSEKNPWGLPAAWGGILLAVWAGPRLPRLGFLEFCGRRSIVLYVAHMPALILAVSAFRDLAVERPVDFFLSVSAVTFGVPLLLAAAYRHTRWLFEAPTTRPRRTPSPSPAPVPVRTGPRHAA